VSTLRPYDPVSGMQPLGAIWTLTKGPVRMDCELSTHSLGWELRRLQDGALAISMVCKSEADVFNTAELWKRSAQARGWRQ
jgi:hypothetical protein